MIFVRLEHMPENCRECMFCYKNRYGIPCCSAHEVEYTMNPEEYQQKRMKSCPIEEE